MKKIISLLFIVTLCFVMASCSVKIKEPKVKGDKISDDDVKNVIKEYENDEDYTYKDKWYDLDIKLKTLYKEDDTELELNAVIKGKVYNAEYDYDKKSNIKIKYDIEGIMPDPNVDDETIEFKLSFDMDMKALNGRQYIDIAIDAKTDLGRIKYKLSNNYEEMGEQLKDALVQLDELLDSDFVFDMMDLEIVESMFELLDGENMLDLLDRTVGDENTEVYKKNNLYTVYSSEKDEQESYSEIATNIVSFELLKNSYQLKKLNYYTYTKEESDDSLMEMTVEAKIDTKLFGSISEPLNKSKYNY